MDEIYIVVALDNTIGLITSDPQELEEYEEEMISKAVLKVQGEILGCMTPYNS